MNKYYYHARPRRYQQRTNPFIMPIIMLGVLALALQFVWIQGTRPEFDDRFGLIAARRGEHADLYRMHVLKVYCEACSESGSIALGDEPGVAYLCLICNGVGYRDTRRLHKDEVLCPACSGMGRVWEDEPYAARTCTRCDFRGVIEPGAEELNEERLIIPTR